MTLRDEAIPAPRGEQPVHRRSIYARLRHEGKGVLLVSHDLQQLWDRADRFVMLGLGELAGVLDRVASTGEQIVQLIVYGAPFAAGAAP